MPLDPETIPVSQDAFIFLKADGKAAMREAIGAASEHDLNAVAGAVTALEGVLTPYMERLDDGVSGTFVSSDGKTVTVVNGIITSITE